MLREAGGYRMPVGPVLMQVNSVLDTVKTEVIIFISNQNKKFLILLIQNTLFFEERAFRSR